MTTDDNTGPPAHRVMCDGGREQFTRTVTAKGVTTREVDGEDVEMLRVPISSDNPDREGDRFDKAALEQMATQIKREQPLVFQNHGLAGSWMDAIPYDQSETIGTHMDAEVVSVDKDDGSDEYALMSYINPDGTHPEGERMLKQVRDEHQSVKFSVGFRIHGYDAREDVEDDYEGDGRVFTSVDLLEDSKVGIPANPDASVTQSVAAKDGMGDLPGYQKHPMFQMMQAMGGGEARSGSESVGVKDGHSSGDGATDSETVGDATPTEIDDLRETVETLTERVETLACKVDGGCEEDADCPDGEVCKDGECVPKDEDDSTDPDAEDSDDPPEAVKELREQNAELRSEVSEIRDALDDGRGDSATGPTHIEDNSPDETDTDDGDSDEQTTERSADTRPATERARGNY